MHQNIQQPLFCFDITRFFSVRQYICSFCSCPPELWSNTYRSLPLSGAARDICITNSILHGLWLHDER